jgi:NTE family protein
MKSTVSIFTQRELMMWAGVDAFDSLRHYIRIVLLEAGDVLFNEGERDDTFYILLNGRLHATSENWKLLITDIEPGRAIGETALLTGRPYIATVTAVEESNLFAITRRAFHQVIKNHPEIQEYFNQIITPRLHSNYLTAILHRLFGDISENLEKLIQEQVVWQQLHSGEILYEQGAAADDMAIVITGRLQVTLKRDDKEQILAEIHHGNIVGEMALLTDEPRSATVRALRQTDIVRLHHSAFENLIESHPEALMSITRTIIERQQISVGNRRNKAKHSLNFALVFLDEVQLNFVDALATQTQAYNSVRVFDAERFSKHYGQSGVAQADFNNYLSLLLNKWLSELEVHHDHVFLVADSEWTNWTIRCLQNADHILFIADSTKSYELREIETVIYEKFPEARKDLILLHPSETTHPIATKKWLDVRKITKHHHIRLGDLSHIARVARHIIGEANGIVLSGGGAIGISHIGVMQAIEEQGMPIDMIAGTSMGALIAAGFALGRSADEMKEMAAQLSDPKKILDWTLPLVSFVATRKVTNMMKDLFGEIRIEDLWIPYFCVSSNLTEFEPAYHQRGLLWRAVRTSTAIPVAMSPIKVGDDLHVDGSIMNNFPVDKMFELVEGGHVIGVMVSPVTKPEEHISDLKDSVSGWQILYNRLNPFSQTLQIPSLTNTFYRSLLVNSKHHFQSVQHLSDLLITIEQSNYGYLEVDKYPELIQLGYDNACVKLRKAVS